MEELVQFIKNGNEVPPIVISEDFRIIDGYNRFEAYKRAGLQLIPVDVYSYASETEMEIHAIILNAKRRHLDSVTAARYALRLAELMAPRKEDIKQKQIEAGKKFHKGSKGLTTPSVKPLRPDRTLEKASKQVGVSPQTVRQVKAVDETHDAELIGAMETKIIPIKKAAEISQIEDPTVRHDLIEAEAQKALKGITQVRDAFAPNESGATILSADCMDCIMKLNHALKVVKFDKMTEEECVRQRDAVISVGRKCKEILDKIKEQFKQLTGKDVE
jgi:hypothetical protein